jgi:hypothetical protein
MTNVPEQKTMNESKEQSPRTDPWLNPSYDTIALAAYFIALDRHARGEAPDPLKDWLEAEQQLTRAV